MGDGWMDDGWEGRREGGRDGEKERGAVDDLIWYSRARPQLLSRVVVKWSEIRKDITVQEPGEAPPHHTQQTLIHCHRAELGSHDLVPGPAPCVSF